jgi:hypothetical protein
MYLWKNDKPKFVKNLSSILCTIHLDRDQNCLLPMLYDQIEVITWFQNTPYLLPFENGLIACTTKGFGIFHLMID